MANVGHTVPKEETIFAMGFGDRITIDESDSQATVELLKTGPFYGMRFLPYLSSPGRVTFVRLYDDPDVCLLAEVAARRTQVIASKEWMERTENFLFRQIQDLLQAGA